MNLWQILCLMGIVAGHSWIDSIYSDENPSVLGYPRNYAGHDASTSITEYKVLVRDADLPACGPSQRTATYSSQYPKLSVSAGSDITATYLENGHVTKDKLPPDYVPHPGNYSWFISPKSGSLTTFGDLTDATRLSGPSPFDDGKCAVDASGLQGRPGPITCLSHFTLPASLAPGDYQLVWWWDFTKLTQIDPSYTEYYTTCLDISVTSATSSISLESLGSPGNISPSIPRYANVSFTPVAYIAAAAASVRPAEKDIFVVSASDAVLTSTYIYEHPVAMLPTSVAAPVPASATTNTDSSTSTVSSVNHLATMYVNPADGSLRPFNLVADDRGVLREMQVSVPLASSPTDVPLPLVPTVATQEAALISTAFSDPSSYAVSTSPVSTSMSVSAEIVEEVVTIYVPTYITVDETCTATTTTQMSMRTTTLPELHTTITMTKTVTMP